MGTPFTDKQIDNFLKDLDKSVSGGIKKKADDKKDKQDEKKRKKAEDLFKNVGGLLTLLTPSGLKLPKEEREKALEAALTGLVGSWTGDEQGHELADTVKDLIDIWRGKKTPEEKKKLLEDAIKKLTTKAGAGVTGAKDKDVGTLVNAVVILLKLATGSLTEAEKSDLLEDNVLNLVTTDLVKRQLEWLITENFTTYLEAVKIGYKLGKPIGDKIARDLAPVIKARVWEDFLVGLEQKDPGWLERVTEGHNSVRVTLEGGSFHGWVGTAFWDYSVGDVRIQVITPKGKVMLLDGNGVDVTGERTQKPTDGAADAAGPVTEHAGDKVEFAIAIADRKQEVKDAKAEMDQLKGISEAAGQAAYEAEKTGDKDRIDAARINERVTHSDYWRARQKWKGLVHGVLLQAAVAENWSTAQFNYMWASEHKIYAVHTWEVVELPKATFTNMSSELSPEDAAKAWPAPAERKTEKDPTPLEAQTNVEQPSLDPPKTYEGDAAGAKAGLFGELPASDPELTVPATKIERHIDTGAPKGVFDQQMPPSIIEDVPTVADDLARELERDAAAAQAHERPAPTAPKEWEPSEPPEESSNDDYGPPRDDDDDYPRDDPTEIKPVPLIEPVPLVRVPIFGLVPARLLLSPAFLVVVGLLVVIATVVLFARPSDTPATASPSPTIAAAIPSAATAPAAPGGAKLFVGSMFNSDSLQNDTCGVARRPHNVYAFFVDVAVPGQASPPPSLIRSVIGRTAHVTLAGPPDAGSYDSTIAETLGRVQIRVDGLPCQQTTARSTFVELRIDGVTLQPSGSGGFVADIPLP